MFNPRSDFADLVDNLEPVSLVRRDGQRIDIVGALRRAGEMREPDASDGAVAAHDVVWHLPASEVGATPELDDVVLDSSGVEWFVQAVESHELTGRWRCAARRIAIADRLDTRVAIERANFAPGQHGEAQPTWNTWRANVPAKIQPVRVSPEIDANVDAIQARATHIVYLGDDIALGPQHRLRAAQGTIYAVQHTERAHRIGELMRVFVEEQS
jgi:hypothetical protein